TPRFNRVRSERWPDGALLHDGHVDRQRSGPELDRELIGAVDREVARDLPGSSEDRGLDDGGGQHLAVQHDREGAADVRLREPAELARARLVEAERNDRLICLAVETRLRI